MAQTPQESRVKGATEALAAARAARVDALPPAPLHPQFRTLESGTVVGPLGAVIYKPPTLPPLGKKKGV